MIDFLTNLIADSNSQGMRIAAAAIALSLVYFTYRVVLVRVMQPVRLRFADEGLELLASDELPEDEKRLVKLFLDDAFEWRLMPAMFVLLLPFIFVKRLRVKAGQDEEMPARLRRFLRRPETQKFSELHLYCLAGSNPVFTLLLMIEVLLILVPALLVFKTMEEIEYRMKTRIVGPLAVLIHGQSPFPDEVEAQRRCVAHR